MKKIKMVARIDGKDVELTQPLTIRVVTEDESGVTADGIKTTRILYDIVATAHISLQEVVDRLACRFSVGVQEAGGDDKVISYLYPDTTRS